ncbi:phosphoinositide 3-kinase [Salpingoeca rosetta]|uniref:Phosphoinositide 3-kinase n=1 Tax=Salpingoeca rosetta (strain ATCC 50818 / BSB-021) TaxID=946362 RepID=F2U2K1_SALR5|nr:phosphoinositide 3-kinase [Salpingoeca rosetta]EGD81356.1 phosphoinositide 3-kinase [Salpingoeca rosetta]|eukprot:XP_004996560.1 phosphoinositide 3-kinase [Salpingoeca rosetta]
MAGVAGTTSTFTCLLPTGMMVQVRCPVTDTFNDLKEVIWKEAARLPFYAELKDPNGYSIQYVNNSGELTELEDEQHVVNVQAYSNFLKLVERKGSKEEQKFNVRVGNLISKHLSDFDGMRDSEVTAFRRNILSVCYEVASARDHAGREGYALHRFPPSIVRTPLPMHLQKKLQKNSVFLCKIRINDTQESTVKCDVHYTPTKLIANVIRTKHVGQLMGSNKADDYVLKVFGREEYLLGNHKMHEYKYIRHSLTQAMGKKSLSDIPVCLVLETKTAMLQKVPDTDRTQLELLQRRPAPIEERTGGLEDSMWFGTYAENKFRVKIVEAQNLVADRLFGIGVKACIYLGSERLCSAEMTRYVPPSDNPVWGQTLEFNMPIKDIPRNARLCLALHGVWSNPLRTKKKFKYKNEFPLAWVNVSILDFKASLRQGQMQLTTWQYDDEEPEKLLQSDDNAQNKLFYPLGTTITNPIKNATPMLTIEFDSYPHEMKYPGQEMIGRNVRGAVQANPAGRVALELKEMEPVVNSDPLHQFTDKELQLLRQYKVNALRGIEEITLQIKDKAIRNKREYARERMDKLKLESFQLPLDPSLQIHSPTVQKIFGSAQKPMWIKFKVAGSDTDYNAIFKNGDDLRQDMLTLQLISIMDQLWQEDGLNLQMNCYHCLSTGDMVGLLQMVTNADTLWHIQGKVQKVLTSTDVLDKWIRDKNPTDTEYNQACTNFMLSCVGYSIATYVLGIADRHNDNIMVKESGQLFHIDFGHFLGNWKSKFGIKRERVKFILVHDFVEVITQGQGTTSPRWAEFKELCARAFRIVRRKANLFINLLNMMLSTGIPELKSHGDVAYLRSTLFLDDSEEVAVDNFMKEVDIALKDSKSVKVNWAFHGAKHG